MKKIFRFIPALFASIALLAASTFSWLVTGNSVIFPNSFRGSTKTAYFAGGNGSKETPYLITNPVHFYNFAWLQYLGYFNLGNKINNGRAQSFFKLSFEGGNLDLGGLAIPPIGTREYPFIGKFDGNNKVISNFTVSNSKADLKKRPLSSKFTGDILKTTETDENGQEIGNPVDIVGLFGITGDFMVSGDNSFVSKNYATGVNVKEKTEPLPDGNTEATDFYYSGMSVSGFYADKIKVNSVSNKALTGLIAGYVCGSLQNTGVYRSKITVKATTYGGVTGIINSKGEQIGYNSVVSKYSLVGDYDNTVVAWSETPQDGTAPGDGSKWGGSIDMRTLNRRLTYMVAKVVTKPPAAGYSYSATSDSWGLNWYSGKGAEFYWASTGTTISNSYLCSGTVLPINVNKENMGLNNYKEEESYGESVNLVNGFHYNDYYKNATAELIGGENTGYIVGGGSKTSSYIVTRVQPLASGSEKGIYKSLGVNPGSAMTYDEENKKKFHMLTLLPNSAGTGYNSYVIKDDVNRDVTSTFDSNIPRETYSNLNFKGYKKVRKNFDNTMVDSQMVHGFHFYNKISETGYESINKPILLYDKASDQLVSHNNYQLIKGGINFTLAEAGEIKTIVGAFFRISNGNNSLFDLYKAERNASGAISAFHRIKNIYKDQNGNVFYDYELTDTANYTKVFSFEDLTKKDGELLTANAAYYFEIPVKKGDYVIGADKNSSLLNAYLMYLDIGANGGDETTTPGEPGSLPYLMKTVDFVSMPSGSADDASLSVPSAYPSYADVGFKLGFAENAASVDDEIYFRRENYNSAESEIVTPVNYYRKNNDIIVYPFSATSGTYGGSDDIKAKWETP